MHTLGQFNQPQVNRYAVRYAGNNPQMLFPLYQRSSDDRLTFIRKVLSRVSDN
jgi:hypothetical protein